MPDIQEQTQRTSTNKTPEREMRYTEPEEETILESGTLVYLSEGRIRAVPVNA